MKKIIVGGLFFAILGGVLLFSIAKGADFKKEKEPIFYYDLLRDTSLEVDFYNKIAYLEGKNFGQLKLKKVDSGSEKIYKNKENNLILKELSGKLYIFAGEKKVFQGEIWKEKSLEKIKEKIITENIWQWENLITKEDSFLKTTKPDIFNLSFKDGVLLGTTECSNFQGKYEIEDEKIKITDLDETKRFCNSRIGDKMIHSLEEADSFAFGKNKEELVLFLKNNAGSMSFNKK